MNCNLSQQGCGRPGFHGSPHRPPPRTPSLQHEPDYVHATHMYDIRSVSSLGLVGVEP